MTDFRPKELMLEADQAVAQASHSPKKLALFHTGVVAAAGLIVTLLSYVLDLGIGNTGGLSGLGNRAVLETAQSALQMLVYILSPFWTLGFTAAALNLARRQRADNSTLTKGLRRWGPALRMMLVQYLLYFVIAMVAVQIGSILYAFSPAADQLTALLGDIDLTGDYTTAVMEAMEQLSDAQLLSLALTILPFFLIPAAVIAIPILYRMRLASYILMDDPRCGALFAITLSFRLTRGSCMKLFKLDLHYWWYYALEVLTMVLAYGEVVLELIGIELSLGAITASVVFYVLALGAQLALYAWKKPQVFTSYALFYDRLKPQQQDTF